MKMKKTKKKKRRRRNAKRMGKKKGNKMERKKEEGLAGKMLRQLILTSCGQCCARNLTLGPEDAGRGRAGVTEGHRKRTDGMEEEEKIVKKRRKRKRKEKKKRKR